MFVDRIGNYRGKVDPQEFDRLAGFIERRGFFSWQPEYSNFDITDQPSYLIAVRRGRETKSVTQYGTDEPAGFGALAARVDALADKLTWTVVGKASTRRTSPDATARGRAEKPVMASGKRKRDRRSPDDS